MAAAVGGQVGTLEDYLERRTRLDSIIPTTLTLRKVISIGTSMHILYQLPLLEHTYSTPQPYFRLIYLHCRPQHNTATPHHTFHKANILIPTQGATMKLGSD